MKCVGPTLAHDEIAEIRKWMAFAPELEEAAELFNLASNPTRLKILYLLDEFKELYRPLGSVAELREHALKHLEDHLFARESLYPLSAAAFEQNLARARKKLQGLAPAFIDRVDDLLVGVELGLLHTEQLVGSIAMLGAVASGCSSDEGGLDKVGCESTKQYFAENAWRIVEQKCIGCHNPQGQARDTKYILKGPAEAGFLDHNIDVISDVNRNVSLRILELGRWNLRF